MIPVSEICERLNARAGELAPELLPNGHRSGNYWMASGIADTGRSNSLAVPLKGAAAGHWRDHGNCAAGEEKGDMLDLIELRLFPGDKKRAVEWAKSYLGIEDDFQPGTRPQPSQEELRRRAELAQQRAEARERELQAEREKKAKRARHLFLGAGPLAGTPAEIYLRGRAIDNPPGSEWPGCLRFHAEAMCGPLRERRPAMIAAIYTASGAQIGAHRTFLMRDPRAPASWTKLQDPALTDPKMVLGNQWGGFIPINKGASGKSMRDMPEGEPVYVTEGIEDALCVRMLKPGARIVCAMNLGNLGAIVLPPKARELVIVADRDDKAAETDKLERAIASQQARGLRVRLVVPPPGIKDINDWVRTVPGNRERRRA